MRRWLIYSACIFVVGAAVIVLTTWQRGDAPDPRNAILAALFWISASLLIPARYMIPRMRREKAAQEKKLKDTFK